jgi:hypothetical protein
MTYDIVELAARNNALWCDAVCRAHGIPGEFLDDLWLNRERTPRFYPDAVTLVGSQAASSQMSALSAMIESSRGRSLAVKDSFSCLDLSLYRFKPLFEAEWISCNSPSARVNALPGCYRWEEVRSEPELTAWECAWANEPPSLPKQTDQRVFRPNLLSDPEIVFVSAWCNEVVVGGGILNRGAEVVGLSNVLTRSHEPEAIWQGLITQAAERFPSLRLVGYERGPELAVAHRSGFESIGPVRVWVS